FGLVAFAAQVRRVWPISLKNYRASISQAITPTRRIRSRCWARTPIGPRDCRAAEQRDELAASHMPFKPWDRDIAPERYHIQTLRLIRICVLLGSDAIRCWVVRPVCV